jgi:hypothetical protein
MPQINLASNVIAALRTFETGQFFSASLAISMNLASSGSAPSLAETARSG